jgi:hypothetical protein
MYKSRLTQWGLKKNYKAAEKEQLARIVKRYRDAGRPVPRLTVRNKPAKLHLVRRFCKEKNLFDEICADLPTAQFSNTKTHLSLLRSSTSPSVGSDKRVMTTAQGGGNSLVVTVHHSATPTYDPERPFSTTSDHSRIELVLFQTNIYFDWCLPTRGRKRMQGYVVHPQSIPIGTLASDEILWGNMWTMEVKLNSGVKMLHRQKLKQGWQAINEACELFSQILQPQNTSLLGVLINILNNPDITDFPGLKIQLLRYFTKRTVVKLGCKHPLSVILFHLQESEIFVAALEPAFLQMIAILEENLDQTAVEISTLKAMYVFTLWGRGDHTASESRLQRYLEQSEVAFGRTHPHTRAFLRWLGSLNCFKGFYELAESKFEDVLRRGRDYFESKYIDTHSIYTYAELARICEGRGDFAQCEVYWQAALTGALQQWGMDDAFTMMYINEVEDSLWTQGVDPEAWLQEHFGISGVYGVTTS